jgi:hypothetical protein
MIRNFSRRSAGGNPHPAVMLIFGMVFLMTGSLAIQFITILVRNWNSPPALCSGREHILLDWRTTQNPDMLSPEQLPVSIEYLIYRLSEKKDGFPSSSYFQLPPSNSGESIIKREFCGYFVLNTSIPHALLGPIDGASLKGRADWIESVVVSTWAAARFGFEKSLKLDYDAGSRSNRVGNDVIITSPHSQSLQIYRVGLKSQGYAYGIVCVWPKGIEPVIGYYPESVQHQEGLDSRVLYLARAVKESRLAANICASLIARPHQIGWTFLPSFLSSNWALSGHDNHLSRFVWSVDSFALDLRDGLRVSSSLGRDQ